MPRAAIQTLKMDTLKPHAAAGVAVRRQVDHGDTAPHDHVFHELVYIEAGRADHETAAGMQPLRPGDLIVFPPYTWHAYHRTSGLTLINCLFDGRLLRRFADLLRPVPGAFDLYWRRKARPRLQPPTVLHCRPAQRSAIVQRLSAIMAEQHEGAPGWELAVTTGLLDILLMTARLWSQQWSPAPVELPPPTEKAVFDAVRYLEDHYTEPVDLAMLARRVHVSRWHLSRSFNQRMGMAVTEFVHRLRIEEACQQLRLTDEPIGRIAAAVGYREIAYFTRCFQKHLGQSPTAYRRASHA